MDPVYLTQVLESLGNMTNQIATNSQSADARATRAEEQTQDIRQRMMEFQAYVLNDKNNTDARFENIEIRMNEIDSGAGKGSGGRSLVDPRTMIPQPINGEPGINGIAWREWS